MFIAGFRFRFSVRVRRRGGEGALVALLDPEPSRPPEPLLGEFSLVNHLSCDPD
jgi:hypothetical protein